MADPPELSKICLGILRQPRATYELTFLHKVICKNMKIIIYVNYVIFSKYFAANYRISEKPNKKTCIIKFS